MTADKGYHPLLSRCPFASFLFSFSLCFSFFLFVFLFSCVFLIAYLLSFFLLFVCDSRRPSLSFSLVFLVVVLLLLLFLLPFKMQTAIRRLVARGIGELPPFSASLSPLRRSIKEKEAGKKQGQTKKDITGNKDKKRKEQEEKDATLSFLLFHRPSPCS